MIIALDYDNTYTRDTVLWDKFIINAQEREHKVQIITSRGKDTPVEHEGWFREAHGVYRAYNYMNNNLGIKVPERFRSR
jgi:hypothetical protein